MPSSSQEAWTFIYVEQHPLQMRAEAGKSTFSLRGPYKHGPKSFASDLSRDLERLARPGTFHINSFERIARSLGSGSEYQKRLTNLEGLSGLWNFHERRARSS